MTKRQMVPISLPGPDHVVYVDLDSRVGRLCSEHTVLTHLAVQATEPYERAVYIIDAAEVRMQMLAEVGRLFAIRPKNADL